MAASGQDWQALKPMSALVDDARAAGHEPLLVETLLVYARTRAPFDPEGVAPLYEEAFKRGEAVHNDSLAAEAAIQLVAIAGIEHRFDTGERWARIADDHRRARGSAAHAGLVPAQPWHVDGGPGHVATR